MFTYTTRDLESPRHDVSWIVRQLFAAVAQPVGFAPRDSSHRSRVAVESRLQALFGHGFVSMEVPA